VIISIYRTIDTSKKQRQRPHALSAYYLHPHEAADRSQTRGLPKKRKRKQAKNNRPTSPPPFFFCGLGSMRAGCPVDMPPHVGTRAASCGVFLYELVPSDGPVVMESLRNNFLRPFFYFSNGHFYHLLQEKDKFATSTTAPAVQSKSNSHVSVYY
jgi:hypothetical protein